MSTSNNSTPIFFSEKKEAPQQNQITKPETVEEFQAKRLKQFDVLFEQIAELKAQLISEKEKTKTYYAQNPRSWCIVCPTDLLRKQLNEILNEANSGPLAE